MYAWSTVKMKKIIAILVILPIILSCMLYSNPSLGESNFPLRKTLTTRIEADIKEIAVGNNWIAVRTDHAVIALDIETLKTLWKLELQVSSSGEGFQMLDDRLITASEEQLILIDKQGNKKEIDVDPDVKTITRILGVYSDYIYVVGGPEWDLEAYDISQNRMLWKSRIGRNVGNVFYDPIKNIAYLTKGDLVRAYDNSSGKVLWEKVDIYGQGTLYSSGILYMPVQNNIKNTVRLAAVDGANQETLWEKDVSYPADFKASSATVIDNLLIYRGFGMIAVDKSNGNLVWTTLSVDEEFYDIPVEFDGVIYVKGHGTGAVYAISMKDGTIIGHARLEDIGGTVISGRIFALKDGIVFNTINEIVIYKAK